MADPNDCNCLKRKKPKHSLNANSIRMMLNIFISIILYNFYDIFLLLIYGNYRHSESVVQTHQTQKHQELRFELKLWDYQKVPYNFIYIYIFMYIYIYICIYKILYSKLWFTLWTISNEYNILPIFRKLLQE
jgi:hypothetical protein